MAISEYEGLTPEGHFPAQNKIREGGKRRDMRQPQENKDSPLDWHMSQSSTSRMLMLPGMLPFPVNLHSPREASKIKPFISTFCT
ncbi:uncharacterized protein LOC144302654 isoform X2 [Canis aureus]